MSNILLINDNVQDYQTIIDACKDNTYAITYNQGTDTYDSILKKYENIVLKNNIQLVNHLALVSHGSNNPEFTFLEKENKMLISQYLPNLSNCASCQTIETEDNVLSLNNNDELFDNTPDVHKYIVDLSLNLTPEEFETKETYTYAEIISIFKDVSYNVFDIVPLLSDISGSDETYPIPYVYDLIKDIHYTITNISQYKTFDIPTIDLSINTPDVHKYIVDLSLNLTPEEFDTKETYTSEEIISIFKDVSYNVFDTMAPFTDISGNEAYTMPFIYALIEDIYYTITDTSGNEDVLTDSSLNGYILNTLDTWSTFKDFIKRFNIKTSLDFLGCALLQSSDWKYTLETLETEQHLHLNIRASDDATGNLKVGADWVLETDNVNIKELYFDGESIEKWYYTLASVVFNVTGTSGSTGITHLFQVPTTGEYLVEAQGGKGGDNAGSGGDVALIKGTFTLQANESLNIIIGTQGYTHSHNYSAGGGGGGSFVVKNVSNPTLADVLVIAGGSGGVGNYSTSYPGPNSQAELPGEGAYPNTGGGSSGTWNSGGGGGFDGLTGDGIGTSNAYFLHSGGKSFINGGRGGYNGYDSGGSCSSLNCGWNYSSTGGYGGGGGSGAHAGGGGGGLYGGDAGVWSSAGKNGKGGGSYNNGSDQVNTRVCSTVPNGHVKITGPLVWPTSLLTVPQTDIKFSDLFVALLNNGTVPGSYSNISFTSIRNTTLGPTLGAIPSSGPISIGSHFKGRTFEQLPLYTLKDTNGTLNRITFTTGNPTYNHKHLGATLVNYRNVYNGCGFESDPSYFNVINGIQLWKVPEDGTYQIEVGGGGGGSNYVGQNGGAGQMIRGTKTLSKGDMLRIIVGSRGGRFEKTAGGGGASAVGPALSMTNSGTASGTAGRWIIAGSGGGGGNSGGNGRDATSNEGAVAGNAGGANGILGSGGQRGVTNNGGWGGGGAGWNSDGGGNNNTGNGGSYYGHYNSRALQYSYAPNGAYNTSFNNPFEDINQGSCNGAAGGFGGGGNGGCNGGGAGAGYTGGEKGGAGGGSYFNTGEMCSRFNGNNAIARDTDGYVKITRQ